MAAYAGDALVLAIVVLGGNKGHQAFKGPGMALEALLGVAVSGGSPGGGGV